MRSEECRDLRSAIIIRNSACGMRNGNVGNGFIRSAKLIILFIFYLDKIVLQM